MKTNLCALVLVSVFSIFQGHSAFSREVGDGDFGHYTSPSEARRARENEKKLEKIREKQTEIKRELKKLDNDILVKCSKAVAGNVKATVGLAACVRSQVGCVIAVVDKVVAVVDVATCQQNQRADQLKSSLKKLEKQAKAISPSSTSGTKGKPSTGSTKDGWGSEAGKRAMDKYNQELERNFDRFKNGTRLS
ncbi:MAG: hypothetical protein JNJ83_22940 [Verrucomicrobiaceae bacterium]|nr:hypothetical protein [Verrucomicrobiaceae bacterium]